MLPAVGRQRVAYDIPVVGLWSDRVGRTAIPLASASAILLLIYPLFAWLVAVPQLTTLLMVQGILGCSTHSISAASAA